MKTYSEYLKEYEEILNAPFTASSYVCFHFLEDNGILANPWEKEAFKTQLVNALCNYTQEEQERFVKAISETINFAMKR